MTKVILVALDLHPQWGSEAGFASAWLDILGKYFAIEAFTQESNRQGVSGHVYANTTFRYVRQNPLLEWLMQRLEWLTQRTGMSIGAAVGARLFFRAVKKELSKRPVIDAAIIHCITPAGLHATNDLYRLGIPVAIGPLGSALPTPKGFEQAFGRQWLEPLVREIAYRALRASRAWQAYFQNAALIILGASLQEDRLPRHPRVRCIRIADALVDTDYFAPPKHRSKNAVVKVLFVGRLVGLKGPLLLLDAVRTCVRRGMSSFVVEIVGWGVLKDELLKVIGREGLGMYVRLLGGMSRERVLEKYRTSDIFCLPTIRESGGTAILEAMSCGLPIITSDYGGPAYFVTQECGIKIPVTRHADYVEKLAGALGYLTENAAVRERMGIAARERAKTEFSLQALEKKVMSAYGMVMKESTPGRKYGGCL